MAPPEIHKYHDGSGRNKIAAWQRYVRSVIRRIEFCNGDANGGAGSRRLHSKARQVREGNLVSDMNGSALGRNFYWDTPRERYGGLQRIAHVRIPAQELKRSALDGNFS
ncbi:MAG: hypothetical protein UX72_C0040G0012 [Parcubacteria group bacterium GW2011_GWA2_47_10]|nr:MAG: hypothetical protein UX72_C0040G0012 [Parcubacteria group bacterium GW2011_GWA2_47_10]